MSFGVFLQAEPLNHQGLLAGFDYCYPIMAPQTGLEPVTPRLTGTVKKSRKPYVSRDLHIVLTTSDDSQQ